MIPSLVALLADRAERLRALHHARRISVGGGLARHAAVATEVLARQLLAGDGTAITDVGDD